MDLFIVDTQPDEDVDKKLVESDEEQISEDDGDYGGLPPPSKNIADIIKQSRTKEYKTTQKVDIGALIERKTTEKQKFKPHELDDGIEKIIQEGNKQSAKVSKPIETQKNLNTVTMSERKLLKLRKTERSKTKGKKWFDLAAPELTEDVKNELEIIKMRSALDTKHFYKRSEMKTLPKYFEVGKIMSTPLEHYSNRTEGKKLKANTLVDELMADAEFQKQNKRRYREVMENKKSSGYYKAAQKMKKLKKRK